MKQIAPPLLAWFYKNRRTLPFRQDPTPYHIWVSEIMLQQTRMTAAVPYYERFTAALPDIPALAACDEERLHKLWQGLGYYSRVRNLQKAAKVVCEQYGGQLPADPDALKRLPGIGDYTAGAIASISFGLPAPAVDGNVLRVFARLYKDDADILLPATKAACTRRVLEEMPADAPGDYNQALMELGALVCTPGAAPSCESCPLCALCDARAAGVQGALPVKTPKKARRIESITLALVHSPAGWLIRRRPDTGLLAGLWQPLLWEQALDDTQLRAQLIYLGIPATVLAPAPSAKHIFTHVEWHMRAVVAETPDFPVPEGCVWATPAQLRQGYAMPGAFKAYRPLLEKMEKL